MSNWTYIYGTIKVAPIGRSQAEKRFILETVLNHLPIIKGSENPLRHYIIQHDGYDSSSNQDEFYWNKYTRLQSTYTVILDGKLRNADTDKIATLLREWIKRFAQRILIKDIYVKLTDHSNGTEITYTNESFDYYKLFQDSFEKDSPVHKWCDFLMFDRDLAPKPMKYEESKCDYYVK